MCGKAHRRRWESCRRKLKLTSCIQSTAGHVKSRGKPGGPPSKPKYYPVTDSEAVPWGKGEKNPGRGVKRTWNLVFTSTQSTLTCDVVLFVERSGEFILVARLRTLKSGAVGKPSVNSAYSYWDKTRNRVTYPWAGWREGKTSWRTEPTPVETLADDLWIAEKFQSNSEIAGSPRNSFRASLMTDYRR